MELIIYTVMICFVVVLTKLLEYRLINRIEDLENKISKIEGELESKPLNWKPMKIKGHVFGMKINEEEWRRDTGGERDD